MDARALSGAHPSNLARRPSRALGCRSSRTRGFTLIEFLVVVSIVMILTAVLMPSLARSRDAADRLRCASNFRQVGGALVGWLDDHNGRLPSLSFVLQNPPDFGEGMILTDANGASVDGLGRLLPCTDTDNIGGYLADARLLYCPCHHGEHPFERYSAQIGGRVFDNESGARAYCNYQYKGPIDPKSGLQIMHPMRSTNVLASDGFKTRSDFNHIKGANRLFGDCHVDWRADSSGAFYKSLPSGTSFNSSNQYLRLWQVLEGNGLER